MVLQESIDSPAHVLLRAAGTHTFTRTGLTKLQWALKVVEDGMKD
jgi:hypothetical protein